MQKKKPGFVNHSKVNRKRKKKRKREREIDIRRERKLEREL
jgi:hypothetical protein